MEARHEIFSKLTGEELKVFILARKDAVPKSRFSKKGKVGDAILGENNIIKNAYNICQSSIILILQLQSMDILNHNELESSSS